MAVFQGGSGDAHLISVQAGTCSEAGKAEGAPMRLASCGLQMADIWSCGIILYAMLFGRYPFNARERDYAKKIVRAQYVVPEDIPVSSECVDLLTRVLVADSNARLSMEDIKMHAWFIQDLPQDALDMNDFYLQVPQYLDMVAALLTPVPLILADDEQPATEPAPQAFLF
jgi:serine/threonine protein kinase